VATFVEFSLVCAAFCGLTGQQASQESALRNAQFDLETVGDRFPAWPSHQPFSISPSLQHAISATPHQPFNISPSLQHPIDPSTSHQPFNISLSLQLLIKIATALCPAIRCQLCHIRQCG
jgi:hypothetical protein